MRQRGVIALGVAEDFKRRHLHMVAADAVIGLGAAVPDGGLGRGKEGLGPLDALQRYRCAARASGR